MSIHALWLESFQQFSSKTDSASARRCANIVVVAKLADARRLGKSETRTGEPEPSVAWLASKLGAAVDLSALASRRLKLAWSDVDEESLTTGSLDDVVDAFQSSGSTRKSLGAFATPRSFADALATLTLGPVQIRKKALRILDPAAGAGALLLACHRHLVGLGMSSKTAAQSLFGAEVDPLARELCILLVWLAAEDSTLEPLHFERNIRHVNAVVADWSRVPAHDVVIMNPPWDSLRHKSPTASLEIERQRTLGRLAAPAASQGQLPPLFSQQGRGDRNLFKVFLELAPHLVSEGGRIGALVPSAFASDLGMKELRKLYLNSIDLDSWTSFENRGRAFPIDSRFKFGMLVGTRSQSGTKSLRTHSFGTQASEAFSEHIELTAADLHELDPSNLSIPELTTSAERNLLLQMAALGEPLFSSKKMGPVRYVREVDMSLGKRRGEFTAVGATEREKKLFETRLNKGTAVPVVEGRMVGQFNCFAKSWVAGGGRTAVWTDNESADSPRLIPQYFTSPREASGHRVAICDVTSATNTRTVLAALVPDTWVCGNTAPVLSFRNRAAALVAVAVLNSLIFDWQARRIVSGLHLNKFYLQRLHWPNLSAAMFERLTSIGERLSTRRGESFDDRVDLELIVASGFSLTAENVEYMLTANKLDRRGFWRAYRADKSLLQLPALVAAKLDRTRGLNAA